jgi:AcrR family transcriptional regulator
MKAVKTTPAPPVRQQRSLETERKLKAAAVELLDEGGLAACTAPAVAARAGVAVGTIYARYADKDALIAAALLDMVSLHGGAADSAFAAFAGAAANLRDFLRSVAGAAVKATREHRTLLLAIREFARKSDDADWRARFRSEQGRGREQLLAAAVRRFGRDVRGGEAALRMALAAIYGAVEVTWLEPTAGLFARPPSPRDFVEALVEMQARYLS